MQVVGENVPGFPMSTDQETVPVGELPVTVAVQDVGEPAFTLEGEQETVVVVVVPCTFRANVPVLGGLLVSPE